ncbi:hypothetical protein ACW5XF_16940 [Aeromonas lusitana]|uniref:Uncharacterized protein n=1 Tax=Aeromonas lusitana TaxID=931529 RepID=A0A2M8HB73_9GAMM|nr:hypothetical protein [Aeromonas lusitana]PJC93824.1 hypothetical protein CUC44_07675 [Aeromonas lusitana]
MRLLFLILLFSTLPARAATEAECQQAFVEWMLSQQQQFSDRKASKMVRRNAERAIDQARGEYAKQESFCQAMALVSRDQTADPRFKPRTGEIHDFTSRR